MITFDEFKDLFDSIVGEPEFEIILKNTDRTYMIIKYDNHVTFQRCGIDNCTGEYMYTDLDEMNNAELLDGLSIKDIWINLETIIANGTFDLSISDELVDFKERFGSR